MLCSQTKARDNESRLYFQAKKECRNIISDLQTKEAYIRDQQKKIRELEAELMDCLHAYEASTTAWFQISSCVTYCTFSGGEKREE